MPIPRTPNAPHFNGKYVTDFLTLITQHGSNAGVTDLDDLVPYIVQYSSDAVKDLIRYIPEFDPELPKKTWAAAEKALFLLYGHAEETPDYSEAMLRDFCQERSAKSPFASKKEIETYLRDFMHIAGPLKKKSTITEDLCNFYFIAGIPKELKEWFQNEVPVAKRKRDSPPTIPESIVILQKRFDKSALTYEPWKENTERKDRTVAFGADGNRLETYLHAPATVTTNPAPAPVHSTSEIDELTRQLEKLHINLAALKLGTSPQAPSTDQTSQGASNGFQKNCFMCGKVGEHPLHPSKCPETKLLLDANVIKYDTNTNRYVMVDGRDLPQTPRGFIGGVAGYIRALIRDQSTAATQETTTARTSSIRLSNGSGGIINDQIFAVSSLEAMDRHADPVTRTGKDTGARFDPTKRPAPAKGKGREGEVSNPSVSAPKPAPAAPINPTNSTLPAPPPNPINREDGWKAARPSNPKQGGDDVVMRDVKKPSPNDKYYITSNIQERANPSAIFEEMMNMQVTVPFFQLVGASPMLQKLFSEATRSKREYGAKPAEFFIDGEQTDTEAFVRFTQVTETGATRVYAENADALPEFLVRYGNAIAKVPEGRYFAMSTGSVSITIAGVELTALIDCGSELNLASQSIPARCSLPVDFEGMKWALKGIHGGPEQLRGCATDVPIRIGNHNFPHHLFISHQELGQHDLILGQPFLQWFAARIDYERSGSVSLYLWKEGNRKVNPTIVVTITDPLDPRNTTTMTHGHAHPVAWVEEVTDEEDF
ncbi:hypothetical protein DFH07DRAFT_762754 [Mycena maculata]|uniref:DUF4100 domain-containing protein n=1 Tax=Mycena maculata TaxID=230809 RepID=A0AAD7H9V3_9AGAR|nr:hypothetical protein DFH07DRAFT_762770 [Mycena maculata]KAJ7715513.1 hypothetical protein DFH07DRAFT_762754 [Mycena maculata]